MDNMKTALIGAGNMGYAVLKGTAGCGFAAENITVCDFDPEKRARAEALGVNTKENPAEAVKGADLIILAVKPNALDGLASCISKDIKSGAVIVSILAGKTIETLEKHFTGSPIVRIMPNTPALVGCGMSGVCRNSLVKDGDFAKVIKIFSGFGIAEEVDESLMDAVTGISGSGPAYAFMFIDGLMKAAVNHGFTEEKAKLFAAQTVLGAAKMVLSSEQSPEQLKINVCSRGEPPSRR